MAKPSPGEREIYRQYQLAVDIYQGLDDEEIRQLVHDKYKLHRLWQGAPIGAVHGLKLLNRETYLEAMKPALMHYGLWPGEDHPSPLDQAAEEYLEIIALQDHLGTDI